MRSRSAGSLVVGRISIGASVTKHMAASKSHAAGRAKRAIISGKGCQPADWKIETASRLGSYFTGPATCGEPPRASIDKVRSQHGQVTALARTCRRSQKKA